MSVALMVVVVVAEEPDDDDNALRLFEVVANLFEFVGVMEPSPIMNDLYCLSLLVEALLLLLLALQMPTLKLLAFNNEVLLSTAVSGENFKYDD